MREWQEEILHKCSSKQGFLKISQTSQENTCFRDSFFDKVAGLRSATLLKKSPWHNCCPVSFANFLRSFFSQNISGCCFWMTFANTLNLSKWIYYNVTTMCFLPVDTQRCFNIYKASIRCLRRTNSKQTTTGGPSVSKLLK